MGSLACDEGATATPASGSTRRDALEPTLRARFKHMQKIGEGTYGVVGLLVKKWETDGVLAGCQTTVRSCGAAQAVLLGLEAHPPPL